MNESRQFHPIDILLVDDDLADIKLTKRALEAGRVLNNVHVVKDGIEAMAFLRGEEKFANAPRPDLVLLDLNMPRMDGREVLQEVKADDHLKSIPIVVLSTSAADSDVAMSYSSHANSYISKPVDTEQFNKAILAVTDYWFSVVKLPQEESRSTFGA